MKIAEATNPPKILDSGKSMTFVSPKVPPALDYGFTAGSETNERHMTGSAIALLGTLVMTFNDHFCTEHHELR